MTLPTPFAYSAFRSPSGNITCEMDDLGTQVTCELQDSAIAGTHDCAGKGTWGKRVVLTRALPATMVCDTGTTDGRGLPVLTYGQRTDFGFLECLSETDGVHCADDQGHGFRLAREAFEIF